MTGDNSTETDSSIDRRTFVKQSAVASMGFGLGVDARGSFEVGTQEDSSVQYYNFVVPDRGIVDSDFVNKFLFTTGFRRRVGENPFDGCFTAAERQVQAQFDGGANVYDGVLVDATETFQLFGDDEGVERLREILNGGPVDLPNALDDNVGAVATTRIFAPVSVGRLPDDEGFRAVGGQHCDGEYVRLRVHELPNEVTG